MKFITSILLVVLLFINSSFATDFEFATCVFNFNNFSSTVSTDMVGSVQIFKFSGDTEYQIYFNVSSTFDGQFAAQILTYGLSTGSSIDLGGSFDTTSNQTSGCPTSSSYRIGDLGNIDFVKGEAKLLLTSSKISLGDAPNSIIGRSIAIYSTSYDCKSDTPADELTSENIAAYCTIGVGNSTFVDMVGFNNPNITDGTNVAKSYSGIDNALAVATVYGTTVFNVDISGTVFFKTLNSTHIQVSAQVFELSYDAHGFHIHQYGERSDITGYAVGGHYTAGNQTHGLPEKKNRHFGDMGNFCAFSEDMTLGYYKYVTDYIRVSEILGRGMAIHNSTDLGTTNVGGARCAQGVIALVNPNSGDVVQLPNDDWHFDVLCEDGPYKGGSQTFPPGSVGSSDEPSSDEPNSASTISSLFALVLISIISTIIFI